MEHMGILSTKYIPISIPIKHYYSHYNDHWSIFPLSIWVLNPHFFRGLRWAVLRIWHPCNQSATGPCYGPGYGSANPSPMTKRPPNSPNTKNISDQGPFPVLVFLVLFIAVLKCDTWKAIGVQHTHKCDSAP